MVNRALENRENRRDAATLAAESDKKLSPEDAAIRNIVRTWSGGEHVLAGKRASDLLYGKGKTLNEKMLERLKAEGALGIERYIAPPSGEAVETVGEESGYPLSTQPENRDAGCGASNASSEAAKDEQDAIDKVTEPGRSQRQNPEESAVNPEGSDIDPSTKTKAEQTKKNR
jgi:hypothetical protein